jgi:cellulose synthase/poly-beta-1,6-N-acetylglucosamine synthase-like glycosyltransferase
MALDHFLAHVSYVPGLALIYLAAIVLLAYITLVVATLFVEVLAARRALWQTSEAVSASWPRVAVLVPAHNESIGIIPTLTDAKGQLRPEDRLLVVADNCSDDTAQVARAQGAEVIERRDPEHRGKGYALSAGVAHLSENPPDIVVIVDADCLISPNGISRLATTCAQRRRPIQANYVMRAPAGATINYDVAAFAWRVKNFVRPLGLLRLGLPCQLTGSGMAFPWLTIRTANLASGNIVEDMALGVELAMRGEPAFYCPDAEVVSTFPTSRKALQTQRRRWEHGHFQTILGSAGPLILSGLANRSRDKIALGLDLAVPPLSALVFMTLAVVILCLIPLWFGFSAAPFLVAAADALFLALAVIMAWMDHGRDVAPAGALLGIAPYLMSQMRIYQSILRTKGAVQWTRTDRK